MRTRSLLILAVAALACSSQLDTSKLDPLSTAEGYCDTLFAEYLTKGDSCYGATQYWVDQQFAEAKAMCANIARMNITYDRSAAESALDAIRAADCRTYDQSMEDADAPLVGRVANYGACNSGVECAAPRSYCVNVAGTCPGECHAPGVESDPCYGGYPQCATGYFCDTYLSTYTCHAKRTAGGDCTGNYDACAQGYACKYTAGTPTYQCMPYQPVGSYCDASGSYDCEPNRAMCDLTISRCVELGRIGEPCIYGSSCEEGSCDTALNRCVAYRPEGATCTSYDQCAWPLHCLGYLGGPVPTGSGTCGRSRALGAACRVGANDCERGAYCSGSTTGANGVCTTWPMHVGELCGEINGEWAECFEGYCPGWSGGPYYCQPLKRIGELCAPYSGENPCSSSSGFGESAWCDYTSGKCVASCN
jgi:hypothetical protein